MATKSGHFFLQLCEMQKQVLKKSKAVPEASATAEQIMKEP